MICKVGEVFLARFCAWFFALQLPLEFAIAVKRVTGFGGEDKPRSWSPMMSDVVSVACGLNSVHVWFQLRVHSDAAAVKTGD